MEWVPSVPDVGNGDHEEGSWSRSGNLFLNRVAPMQDSFHLPAIRGVRDLDLDSGGDGHRQLDASPNPACHQPHPLAVHSNGEGHNGSSHDDDPAAIGIWNMVSGSSPVATAAQSHCPPHLSADVASDGEERQQENDTLREAAAAAATDSASRADAGASVATNGGGPDQLNGANAEATSNSAGIAKGSEPAEQPAARPLPWRRDRHFLERRIRNASLLLAITGITGAICASISLELIIYGASPRASSVDLLKLVNSILTVGMVVYSRFPNHSLRPSLLLLSLSSSPSSLPPSSPPSLASAPSLVLIFPFSGGYRCDV